MTTKTKTHYIKSAAVRKLIKSHGKRTSIEFLASLDRWVEAKLLQATSEHNGGRKTLDADLASYLLNK